MASVSYFLKLEGVEGESQIDGHKGEIQLEEARWTQENVGGGTDSEGPGAGAVKMNDFVVFMRTNKATPNLMLACPKGDSFSTAVITFRKDNLDYLKWHLAPVKVSRFIHVAKESVSPSGEKTVVPLDEVHLHFQTIDCEHKGQKKDASGGGSNKKGWDKKEGKPR